MKQKIINILVGMAVIGALVSGASWWAVKQDFANVEPLKQEVRLLRDTNWELESKVWELEDQLASWERDGALQKRSFDRALKTTKEHYEDLIVDLKDEIEALEDEIEVLKEELAKDSYGGWEGLENFSGMEELYSFLAQESIWRINYTDDTFDCDDYTFLLMKHGAAQGKAVYPLLVISMQGYYVVGLHTMNFVIVSRPVPGAGMVDFVVAIEPQTLTTTLIGRVDDKASWITKWYSFLP
jgi:cell division protein FtsB